MFLRRFTRPHRALLSLLGLVVGLVLTLNTTGFAMTETTRVQPVALRCTLDASVPADAGDAICTAFRESLTARYPQTAFAPGNAEEGSAAITLTIEKWRDTGLDLALSWPNSKTGTLDETRRSLSISDRILSTSIAIAFVQRILSQTDFPL